MKINTSITLGCFFVVLIEVELAVFVGRVFIVVVVVSWRGENCGIGERIAFFWYGDNMLFFVGNGVLFKGRKVYVFNGFRG